MVEKADHAQDLTVTVHNEDEGGAPIVLHAGPGTPVKTIIERFYEQLGVERKPTDRLTCLATGADVFSHNEEHLGVYAESQCATLEWGWSRATGGA